MKGNQDEEERNQTTGCICSSQSFGIRVASFELKEGEGKGKKRSTIGVTGVEDRRRLSLIGA
jgi:hypothetical protein